MDKNGNIIFLSSKEIKTEGLLRISCFSPDLESNYTPTVNTEREPKGNYPNLSTLVHNIFTKMCNIVQYPSLA